MFERFTLEERQTKKEPEGCMVGLEVWGYEREAEGPGMGKHLFVSLAVFPVHNIYKV